MNPLALPNLIVFILMLPSIAFAFIGLHALKYFYLRDVLELSGTQLAFRFWLWFPAPIYLMKAQLLAKYEGDADKLKTVRTLSLMTYSGMSLLFAIFVYLIIIVMASKALH